MPEAQTSISLCLSKIVNAPRQRVFDAWVKPELRKRWWSAAEGMTCGVCEIDARKGGRYRISMKQPPEQGDKEYVSVGEFIEIDEPSKLVFTWSWEHYDPGMPGTGAFDTLVTIEFREVDGGTEVVLTHERFANAEIRDDHQKGWTGCLASLAQEIDAG